VARHVPTAQYPWPIEGDFDPARCAVLSIDWQLEFCERGGLLDRLGFDTSHRRAALPAVARVLSAARSAAIAVVHTREGYQPDLSDCPPTKLAQSKRGGYGIGEPGPLGRVLICGERGWQIDDQVAPEPGEWIIDKPSQGAFCTTDLDSRLRSRGIDALVFMGTTADCCVSSTLREACDRGYDCLVLTDCVADVTAERTCETIRSFETNPFGATTDSATFIAAIEL
jgi:nicotinamidase-related amidase